MLRKMAFFITVAAVFMTACGGETHVYKGTLTVTIEKSGSGDYVGSGNDEVDVTVTKHNEDEMSINFKTVGDSKIKSEMESCTLKMSKSGTDWTEYGSKKCTAEGQDYQILKGTGVMSGKELRLSFEAVPFSTGKTNKYRFEGIEN
ncbi:MAG: hypothetical protein ABL999_09435 [Pyrinomonadaceae bacterium]